MKTKHVQYETHGTCSKMIDVTADENNVIQQVFFLGGCNGNLQGISQLVKGQRIEDVIPKINGIRCGAKGTSCPDQVRLFLNENTRIHSNDIILVGKKGVDVNLLDFCGEA